MKGAPLGLARALLASTNALAYFSNVFFKPIKVLMMLFVVVLKLLVQSFKIFKQFSFFCWFHIKGWKNFFSSFQILSEKNEVQERAFFRRRYLAATIFDKNSYHTFHFYGKLSVSCFQWSCHQIRKISGTMMPLLVQKLDDIFALHA